MFTSETIGILLETENNNFAEVDVGTNEGPMEYTLSAAPPPAHGSFPLINLTGADWRFNRSGHGAGWASLEFDDSQAGWNRAGPFLKTPNLWAAAILFRMSLHLRTTRSLTTSAPSSIGIKTALVRS